MFKELNNLNKRNTQSGLKKPSATSAASEQVETTVKKPVAAPAVRAEGFKQPVPFPSIAPIEQTASKPDVQSDSETTQEHDMQSRSSHVAVASDGQSVNQSTGRLVDRPISQSTGQPITQSTSQSTHSPNNRIVSRPKAFYITERLDARLDVAVKYLQEQHGIRKVDRSTVVNALLDNEANWTEENLDLLVSRIISLLTSRLTS